jgi:uncharacterized damage-inducible protein DinB
MKISTRGGTVLLALSVLALLSVGVRSQAGWRAQTLTTADPLTQTIKAIYEGVKRNVIESAEVLPEAEYGFKPTPEVRSYGQTIGHIANAHYSLCASVKAEESPNTADLEELPGKAEFVKAIKDSYAYCDSAFEGMSDAKAMELITVPTGEVPRVRNLIRVVTHDDHEYGKLVTYLRLKGIVPPSTARRGR